MKQVKNYRQLYKTQRKELLWWSEIITSRLLTLLSSYLYLLFKILSCKNKCKILWLTFGILWIVTFRSINPVKVSDLDFDVKLLNITLKVFILFLRSKGHVKIRNGSKITHIHKYMYTRIHHWYSLLCWNLF